MKYAILAAGEGSRLKEEGISEPKPLVRVGEETLLTRLLRIFMHNDAEEIVVVCNDLRPEVDRELCRLEREGLDGRRLPLRHVVQTTPSSMHSMYALRHELRGGKFVLTTVDTFFSEERFARYVRAFACSEADGMMAVTGFVDDEKPLFVSTSSRGGKEYVDGFLDTDTEGRCHYVSAGIYGLSDKALATLERCVESGQSRMRNFQRALLAEGQCLEAYDLGRVTDIDHAGDIPPTVLGITRHEVFSPGSVAKDAAIMHAVMSQLQERGCYTYTLTERELRQRDSNPRADLCLSMARSGETLSVLREMLMPVINTPAAVSLCTNRFYINRRDSAQPPLWVKRTDTCAESEGDVVFCNTMPDVSCAMQHLLEGGVDEAHIVLQPHYEGDVVKFYGVAATGFFFSTRLKGGSKDKFGRTQPEPHGYLYDEAALHRMAADMAADMCTDIYGGDAIVSPCGSLHIVDFNDWPSFAPCRDDAARAIADMVLATLHSQHSANDAAHARAFVFDYGATLDTRGEHWSRVIWRHYESHRVAVTWEQFWEAYKQTERLFGSKKVIYPGDDFFTTLSKKIHTQMEFLHGSGALGSIDEKKNRKIVESIYAETLSVVTASRRRLQRLQRRGVPMVLVSNFYGNIETVLSEFGLREFFLDIIESATVGIRKPDARLWQMAIDRLRLRLPDLQPGDIMVIGDSLEKDIEPARQLGCQTFHVTPESWQSMPCQ